MTTPKRPRIGTATRPEEREAPHADGRRPLHIVPFDQPDRTLCGLPVSDILGIPADPNRICQPCVLREQGLA